MPFVDSPKILCPNNWLTANKIVFEYGGNFYYGTKVNTYNYPRIYIDVDGNEFLSLNGGNWYRTPTEEENSRLIFTWVLDNNAIPNLIPINEVTLLLNVEPLLCVDYSSGTEQNYEKYQSLEINNFDHGFYFYWDSNWIPTSHPSVTPLTGDNNFGARWMIHDGTSFPYFVEVNPAWYSPPLQTRKAYALIYDAGTDPSASMNFNDKWYKFVEYLEVFPWYKGEIDEPITHEYGGDTIEYDGVTYYFLASGIEMRGTLGGYGEYTDETERTVALQGDMSANVNFYYVTEKQKSDKIILKGVSTLQASLQSFDGTTIEEITATIKSISKFLARSKRISIEPVKIELQLAPGDEIIIDSNYMIAIKNGTENVSNKLLGRFPVLMSGENIITYTDNETERTVEITVDQKDRWH